MGHKFTNHLPLALLIGLAITLVIVSMILFTRSFVTASSELEQPLTSNGFSGKPNKPTPQPATVDWDDVTNKPVGFADDLDNDALEELACDTSQLAKWNGSAWECFSLAVLEEQVAALVASGDHYTDSEAVTAMEANGESNPLNHNRYTDAEARAASSIGAYSFICGGCNLGENLTNALLPSANLVRASIVDTNLSGSNLDSSRLERADLSGSNFTGANLRSASLIDAELNGVIFTGAILQSAKLRGANLSGLNMSNADLTQADVRDTNLNNADLRNADLSFAEMTGASLIGADLTGVIWFNTICPDGSNSNDNGGTCVNNLTPTWISRLVAGRRQCQ